jgi:hypothetical protein
MLGKFVSFIASCTFCMAEMESLEGVPVIRLTTADGVTVKSPTGVLIGRQLSWTTGNGLGITARTTTVLNV